MSADSFLNKDRLLTQHQAVLAIIQGIVDNPQLTSFRWLDLGCGKGQLIINLEENFSELARSKIDFFAYDTKENFLSITLKKAESLHFRKVHGKTGDITDFSNLYNTDQRFDFITSINTLHEFPQLFIPELMFETIIRLTSNGILFIYDMESLPAPELGAITWSGEEIGEILRDFLLHLGIEKYHPQPRTWKHSSCNAWNIQLQRDYFAVDDKHLFDRKEEAIGLTKEKVKSILKRKLDTCCNILDSITKYGPENEDEYKMKEKLLYDFWALERLKRQNND